MLKLSKMTLLLGVALGLVSSGCTVFDSEAKPKARMTMFVGIDVSGSFHKSGYYEDSLDFLAHYIYSHINGVGGLEVPNVLFVSSIGGAKVGEAKTFYPIQTFENKTVVEIRQTLIGKFNTSKPNQFTDFNAFFEQCALMVKNKNLVLRPISIIMLSDGVPDVKKDGKTDFRSLKLKPLEQLARNVTVRLLYTDAVVGSNWQRGVPRRRVKVWTQDAEVMVAWKDPKILQPDTSIEEQAYFFSWVKDNVDFGVRGRRVN